MGLFDRFKKKTEPVRGQSTNFEPEPLEIMHGKKGEASERIDKVYFHDLIDIDGKQVKRINIRVGGERGATPYYIEPVYGRDNNGNIIDITEQYYREQVAKGGAAFIAVKGFFQPRDITEEKMGSNYIGGLVYNEQTGKYHRNYDEVFRNKYISKVRQQRAKYTQMKQQQVEAEERKKEENIAQGRKMQEALAAGTYPPEDTTGYAGVLTQTGEYKKIYGDEGVR